MDANSTASVVAAIAAVAAAAGAFASLPFSRRAANAANAQTALQQGQTALQQEVAKQANQPYLWADIRVDEQQGWVLNFVVGNSGPTVATDVVVHVDPPLPVDTHEPELVRRAFERLRDGIRALPPGRVIKWSLGASPTILESDEPQPFTITVNGNGPHGPVETLTYVIDLADFRESNDSPEGSLHHLTRAVTAIEKKM